jgi:hypothetical protein
MEIVLLCASKMMVSMNKYIAVFVVVGGNSMVAVVVLLA